MAGSLSREAAGAYPTGPCGDRSIPQASGVFHLNVRAREAAGLRGTVRSARRRGSCAGKRKEEGNAEIGAESRAIAARRGMPHSRQRMAGGFPRREGATRRRSAPWSEAPRAPEVLGVVAGEGEAGASGERGGAAVCFERGATKQKPLAGSPGGVLMGSLAVTYFRTRMCTIIGATSFHGPVRDGKGWVQSAMAAKHNLSACVCMRKREEGVVWL